MNERIEITVELDGQTLTGQGSVMLKHEGCFFIICVLSGIPPASLMREGFVAYSIPDSDLPYLNLDFVIEWHERALASTDGKQGDRVILATLREWREALRNGNVSAREVA